MSNLSLRNPRSAPFSPHRIENAAIEIWIAGACLAMAGILLGSRVASSTWHSWRWPAPKPQNELDEVQSQHVQFKLTGERFPIDIIGSYNIDRAKAIIAKAPRTSRPVAVAFWRAFADRMEWKHLAALKDSTIDYSVPVIIATANEAGGNYMLIDGWHRIQKASEEGQETIQAFYLTEEESKEAFDISWGGSNPAGSFV